MLSGSCHCGAVKIAVAARPRVLVSCNCSICRRTAALWSYYDRGRVKIRRKRGATVGYTWGGRHLRFVRCTTCGCLLIWEAVDRSRRRMGVNFRNFDPQDFASARIRRLDGAKTWKFLD
jgi:hypothetical protein